MSAAVALGALALTLSSATPARQQAPATTATPRGDARGAISAEGEAALNRLRAATERSKAGPTRLQGPVLPAPPDPAARRRADKALRRHIAPPAIDERTRAALKAGKARLAVEREAMAARLRQALGLEAPEVAAIIKTIPGAAPKVWVPVLFVSSSMPVTTLRNYATQLERVGGVLAFRGMPGGLAKVAPMAKLSAEILRLDPGCSGPNCAMRDVQLIVDPILFRQHGVARVPALAMIPGDPTQAYCERDEESLRANHLVYGDSALSGLLEQLARLGGQEEVRDAQARLAAR